MFKIEITSIEELIAFISIINFDNIEEFKKLTNILNKSSQTLIDAERKQQDGSTGTS